MRIGRSGCGGSSREHGISFQRTRNWKESTDPAYDAKLERIEDVMTRFPDRVFAFDQFAPVEHPALPRRLLGARKKHPDRLPAALVADDRLIVTAGWPLLELRRQRLHPRIAHPDPQRLPTGHLGDSVELADDEGAPAVGLDDLDLDAVAGTDLVGGTERHALHPVSASDRFLPVSLDRTARLPTVMRVNLTSWLSPVFTVTSTANGDEVSVPGCTMRP